MKLSQICLLLGTMVLTNVSLKADDAPKEPPKENKEAPQDPNVIKGWGRWQDPDRDCRNRIENGKLQVWIPGTAHDLSVEQDKMNAPMVLQETQGDFDIEVKVRGTFTPGEAAVAGRTPYQGAGLVMAVDNRNYIRLERAVYVAGGQPTHYINFEVRLNGQVQRIGQSTDFPVPENVPVGLRLKKRGNQVQAQVNVTGENWEQVGIKTFTEGAKIQAGVAAVNATKAPLTTQFENIKLTTVERSQVRPR